MEQKDLPAGAGSLAPPFYSEFENLLIFHPLFCNSPKNILCLIHNWCIFASLLNVMVRQSISFTKPNDDWLKAQVESDEYSSKSELVNDLIRQARKQQAQIDWIRAKLEKSERSGFTDETKDQILNQSKSLLSDGI